MPTVHYIAKAATPEQLSWRARIARNERPLREAFLAWVAALQAAVTETAVAHAILTQGTRVFDHVVQAVAFHPDLAPVAEEEAAREFDRIVHQLAPKVKLSFNLRDPNFALAVQAQQAALVREVTDETRRAIANAIQRGYTAGMHPYEVAPQIRSMIGLTSRQAQAVLSFRNAQAKAGVRPDQVAARTDRYAARMLTRRARTIAVTETARAATFGRLASWDQAAAAGLFDRATAEMEWSSVQDDPDEICAQLNGTTVPLGGTWDGLLPGDAHPLCRCAAILRLPGE